VKIGILGFGYMGEIRFGELRARSDCEVARVFHTDDSAPLRSARWQDIVDDPAIDAVFVCLPNHLTCEATIGALSAGKHVFAEKPPGISVREVRAMIAAERASRRTLQFGFDLRQHGAIRRARSLVTDGELGAPRWLRGAYGKPRDHALATSWRSDRARAGGGILLDQGIHLLDVFVMLAGPFDDVHAVAAPAPPALEDDVMVILRTADGRLASLHSSHTQSPPLFAFDVGLERGAIHVEGLVTKTGRYGSETITWGSLDAPREHRETFATQEAWSREIDAFLAAARAGSRPTTGSTDDALEIMMLVERIHAAAGLDRGSR
jgi:predicted dehydrogenase